MSIDTTVRITLRQAVKKHSEAIVNRASQTLSEGRMADLKDSMKQNQLDNLLGVALETTSPTVIVNWIRYQMGRAPSTHELKGWVQGKLGETVIADIESLKEIAEQVAGEVWRTGDAHPSTEQVQQAHVALIRLYAGYLRRWFVARGGRK